MMRIILRVREQLSFRKASNKKRGFLIAFYGFVAGLLVFLKDQSLSATTLQDYGVISFAAMYMLAIALGGHISRVRSVLPKTSKRIVGTYRFWYGSFSLLVILPLLATMATIWLALLLLIVWLFVAIVIFILWPCIYSLVIYVSTFQYLLSTKNEEKEKKKITDSLSILTLALGTPWILAFIFSISLLGIQLPYWGSYALIVGTYVGIFLATIDLPFHLGLEESKRRSLTSLEKIRESLVAKLCDSKTTEKGLSERIAIELNIDRIDRDIDEIVSRPTHPYNVMKPIISYLIVSIFTVIFIELFLRLI